MLFSLKIKMMYQAGFRKLHSTPGSRSCLIGDPLTAVTAMKIAPEANPGVFPEETPFPDPELSVEAVCVAPDKGRNVTAPIATNDNHEYRGALCRLS